MSRACCLSREGASLRDYDEDSNPLRLELDEAGSFSMSSLVCDSPL